MDSLPQIENAQRLGAGLLRNACMVLREQGRDSIEFKHVDKGYGFSVEVTPIEHQPYDFEVVLKVKGDKNMHASELFGLRSGLQEVFVRVENDDWAIHTVKWFGQPTRHDIPKKQQPLAGSSTPESDLPAFPFLLSSAMVDRTIYPEDPHR